MVVRRVGVSRALFVVVAAVLVLSACGDDALTELTLIEGWIDDGRTPVEDRRGPQPIAVDPNVPRSIETVLWHNGWEPIVASDPAQVVIDVWETSNLEDSFVQASPNEIAAALPGVKIPGTLPATAQEITSQLVYAGTTGVLDQGVVAAFGFWNVRAYSVNRATGQLGVLSVAWEEERPIDPTDASAGCDRFNLASECEPTTVGLHAAWWVTDIDGETLVWLDTDFRYELLRRPRLARNDAEMMATSMVLISALRPPAGG